MPSSRAAEAAAALKKAKVAEPAEPPEKPAPARPGIMDAIDAARGGTAGPVAGVDPPEEPSVEPSAGSGDEQLEGGAGPELGEPEPGEPEPGELLDAGPGPGWSPGVKAAGPVDLVMPPSGEDGAQVPIIDRVGLEPPVVIPAAADPPPPPAPAPERIPDDLPAPGTLAAVLDVDVDEVLAGVGALHADTFGEADEDMRPHLRDAMQSIRKAFAIGRAKGQLPPRTLSVVLAIDPALVGRAQIFVGDRTAR